MAPIGPGQAWPPAHHATLLARVEECQEWWEGTSSRLTTHYSGTLAAGAPSRAAGDSMRDAMQSWYRGARTTESGQERVHVPLAADLAQTSAALLFADPPAMTVHDEAEGDEAPTANAQAALRLDKITNGAEAHASLLAAAEVCAAIGGVYGRVVWDRTVADHAWIDWVDGDRGIPEWRWGRLSAVTFYSEHADQGVVYRHLERYEPGRVVHSLLRGDDKSTGRLVPLTDHPATEALALAVDADGAIPTGSPGLAARYFPNARPNPEWRSHTGLRHLGRPDLSRDVLPLMAQVDVAFSSLMRDVRLAKARLVASDSLLQSNGPGRGSRFDTDREVFAAVNDGTHPDGTAQPLLQAHQFAIRITEHTGAADALVREVLRRVGYSPMTFGMVDPTMAATATATEVHSRDRVTNDTRKAKSRLWRAGLGPLLRVLLEVDAHQFGTGAVVTEDVEVSWSESVQDTPLVRAQTVQALEAARAVSVETKVATLHPDWDKTRRDDEVALIYAEQGMLVDDPMGAGETQQGEPDAPAEPTGGE